MKNWGLENGRCRVYGCNGGFLGLKRSQGLDKTPLFCGNFGKREIESFLRIKLFLLLLLYCKPRPLPLSGQEHKSWRRVTKARLLTLDRWRNSCTLCSFVYFGFLVTFKLSKHVITYFSYLMRYWRLGACNLILST